MVNIGGILLMLTVATGLDGLERRKKANAIRLAPEVSGVADHRRESAQVA